MCETSDELSSYRKIHFIRLGLSLSNTEKSSFPMSGAYTNMPELHLGDLAPH